MLELDPPQEFAKAFCLEGRTLDVGSVFNLARSMILSRYVFYIVERCRWVITYLVRLISRHFGQCYIFYGSRVAQRI